MKPRFDIAEQVRVLGADSLLPLTKPGPRYFMGQSYDSDIDIVLALMHIFLPGTAWAKHLTVADDPDSKARARFGKTHVYAPKPKGEANLKWQLRSAFPEPLAGNVTVVCIFYRSTRQRIDVDNMLKQVMDTANKICWNDDSQVTAQAGFIELDAGNPRTIIVIGPHKTSMERSGIAQTAKERVCVRCGRSFKGGQQASTKFCSRECAAEKRVYLKDEVKCAWCSKLFRRRTAAQRFCSDECRLASLHASTRAVSRPKAHCRICGTRLSKPGYGLCRSCWRTAR